MSNETVVSQKPDVAGRPEYVFTIFADAGDLIAMFRVGRCLCGVTFMQAALSDEEIQAVYEKVCNRVDKTGWRGLGDLVNLALSILFKKHPKLKELLESGAS